MHFSFFLFVLGLLLSFPLLAKGPPPGTGVGDVKANIMIMLDDSGSMSATDHSTALHSYSMDVAVANNGNIFVVDENKDRVTRLDSLYGVLGHSGSYNNYNNDTNGFAKYKDPYGLAMDQGDLSDEFFYVANNSRQNGRNSFGNSYISKVCTGITLTTDCPAFGKLSLVTNPGTAMSAIAVQGNYVYAMGHNRTLYKFSKWTLNQLTSRSITGSISNFDHQRSDIAAAGNYVLVSNYQNSKVCKFNAVDLSDANFSGGSHCKTLPFQPHAMAISGKTTASINDDYMYFWRNNSSNTLQKYDVDTATLQLQGVQRGSSAGQIQSSYAIDVDTNNNIYVVERGNQNRQYMSKFDSTFTYIDRGPGDGGSALNRMEISHAAIRAILVDPDLTSGANFGIMRWGTQYEILTNISPSGATEILDPTTGTLAMIYPRGGTYLGTALRHVRNQYWHNAAVTPIDLTAPCQGNFNLIISDGEYFGNPTPEQQMPILTNHATMPVKSFIVGVGNAISGSNNFNNLSGPSYGDTTPPGALFATNVRALTLQLRSAILAAINGNLTFSSPKVDFNATPNGYICQPSFLYQQEDQWKGLLTRYQVRADGSIDDPEGLNPLKTLAFHEMLNNRQASIAEPTGRKIWTVDHGIENPTSGVNKNNNFDPGYIKPSGTQHLVEESTSSLMLEGETHLGTRDVARIMRFMRGHDMFDQDSDCVNSIASPSVSINSDCYTEHKGGPDATALYKLHDFYNSTPAYIGKPTAIASNEVSDTENEYRYDNNYNAFKTAHQDRQNVLLIGSNGGMLHAFDNGCNVPNATCPNISEPGKELWAFVPPAIMKNFQNIVTPHISTTLTQTLSHGTLPIQVVNTAGFPNSGYLRIGNEFIYYTSKTADTFTVGERGFDCGTVAPGNVGLYCDGDSVHATDAVVWNETTVRKPQYAVFGVDGPVVAKDIYTDGSWKTIAMVGFGKGGRGYTALDVTDPESPVHMFTILNDIRGPGLQRSVKVWRTIFNSATNNYETTMNDFDYNMLVETTSVQSLVDSGVTGLTAILPVADASNLNPRGFISVANIDGTTETIQYLSKSGNNLVGLVRGTPAIDLLAGAVVTQDSTCDVVSSNVPAIYNYTRLALTTSIPYIINVKRSGLKKWVAVFGAGQNYGADCTTGNAVYVMDLEDNPGALVKEIIIPDDPSNLINNTVNANLAMVQQDNTSKADYYGALVYFADLENKLWKIDLTDKGGSSDFGRKIKLFEDVASDTNGRRNYQEILPVIDTSQDVPIQGLSTESNILRLYWGTGDMNNLGERNNNIANRLYGISDMTFTNFSLSWQDADESGNFPALYSASDCTDTTSLTAGCPVLNNVGSKNIGWYINLSDSRKTTGQKALYDKEQIYFVIYHPSNLLCSPGDAISGTYGYMCPNEKRLVIALGAGLGTGATTQGSQIYIGVSNPGTQGTYTKGTILEEAGSGFGIGGSASSIAQEVVANNKGTESIIVLSPVGTTSTGLSSIDAWRHYSGENYYDQ